LLLATECPRTVRSHVLTRPCGCMKIFNCKRLEYVYLAYEYMGFHRCTLATSSNEHGANSCFAIVALQMGASEFRLLFRLRFVWIVLGHLMQRRAFLNTPCCFVDESQCMNSESREIQCSGILNSPIECWSANMSSCVCCVGGIGSACNAFLKEHEDRRPHQRLQDQCMLRYCDT